MDQQLINPYKLHKELEAAGLPVISVHSTGQVDYSHPLKPADQQKADQIIYAHYPNSPNSITSDQMLLPF